MLFGKEREISGWRRRRRISTVRRRRRRRFVGWLVACAFIVGGERKEKTDFGFRFRCGWRPVEPPSALLHPRLLYFRILKKDF